MLFFLLFFSVLFWGNIIGISLPHEIPPVNSVITEKIQEAKSQTDNKHYENLKNKKGISKMFVTYNLAYLESSYNRHIDYKNDILLFFDIVSSLPEDSEVTMFYFYDNKIIMDFKGNDEFKNIFCNNLAKTGCFSQVYSEDNENITQITVEKL